MLNDFNEVAMQNMLYIPLNTHIQLRTMASETVDLIDWSQPPPSWAVPPESLLHSINQCNLSGNQTCSFSMRSNHLAYAATQRIRHWINHTCLGLPY